MQTKQIVIQDLITRYSLSGSGKTVLLLHGWGDSLVTFHELVTALENNYQVLSLDLPGFGQTQAPPHAWGLTEYAEFVAAFLRKLECEPTAMAGHSNGGAIAIKGLAEGIFTTDKLVLLASAGIRRKGLKKGAVIAGAKAAKLLTVALPKKTRQNLRNKLYGTLGSDYLAVPHMQETFKRVVGEDVLPDAAKLSLPTLLIYGTEDEATPVSYGEVFAAAIKGARLEVVSGAGHFVHHDKKIRVIELVNGFLK